MAKSKLFQYVILWHPNEKEEKEGKKSEIIKELTTILEKDEKTVSIKASREIPDKYMDSLEQVEVVIVNF